MIDEIAVALNQGLYLVALSAALTLPDVCGKAEYPEERVSTRYKKWYSTFVPDGNLPEDSVYALRCSLLHEGNTNAKDKNDIKFQLILPCTLREKGTLLYGNYRYNDLLYARPG